MTVLLRGGIYFAIVFAVGFLLGTIRVLWLVPALGERSAELAELPLMLGASYGAARFVVRRFRAETRRELLASGLFALTLLLGFELTVVLAVRGLTMADYVASRDPVAGTAYVASLLAFAVLPWAIGRRSISARAM